MAQDPPPTAIRRVVTGHDSAGEAVVWMDGPAVARTFPDPRTISTTLWVTEAVPARFDEPADMAERNRGLAPPENGTRFGTLDLAPGRECRGLHRTDTVDYVVCVAGEITMLLEQGEVVLRAGDVLVQRGTFHGWSNRGHLPARIAFVLIDGEPKRPKSVSPRGPV